MQCEICHLELKLNQPWNVIPYLHSTGSGLSQHLFHDKCRSTLKNCPACSQERCVFRDTCLCCLTSVTPGNERVSKALSCLITCMTSFHRERGRAPTTIHEISERDKGLLAGSISPFWESLAFALNDDPEKVRCAAIPGSSQASLARDYLRMLSNRATLIDDFRKALVDVEKQM